MNSLVIYYTCAGSTRKIAEGIHKGLSLACLPGERADIARLRDVDAEDLDDYDIIGVGGPVYHFQEIGNITELIEYTMASVEGKYGFAFCTHGSQPGNFLSRTVSKMAQRGMIMVAWNDWFGNVFHPCIRIPPNYTTGHPDEIDMKEAEDFGRRLVEYSRRISNGETQLIPTFPVGSSYEKTYYPHGFMGEGPRIGQRRFSASHTLKFTVDLEKCKYPKCHVCIDNCHTGCIEFTEDPPTRNFYCDRYIDRCWLCEMICPNGAIEYDYIPFQRVHGGWPLMDQRGAPPLMVDVMKIWEEKGKFRNLVPPDEQNWDTPVWKLDKPRLSLTIQNKPKGDHPKFNK